ncbi:MAG TPA: CDP-glycerol glycerophosphotransferase family protein [Chitinophagaceae bacterium]|nr:CDP-glycerol glycerophosphotransferase family protein [Chitinophagaceae bacterium]
MGEIQFYKDVLDLYRLKNPDSIIIIAHENEECYLNFIHLYNNHKFIHIHINVLQANFFSNKEISLYLTTENLGIQNIYSIYLFHGQPSKALSFHWDKLLHFDAFFLYGPMHKEALYYFSEYYYGKLPENVKLFEVGYPKMDRLINRTIIQSENINELGIDKRKKTILYAPAFNEYASLREYGIETLKELAKKNKYNVVAKLPVDCLRPPENNYANGGVNWFEEITKLCKTYSNIFLYKGHSIEPLLVEADIMITCISSVSFEFLALKKPVIYIDTPNFFDIALKETYFPGQNTNGWDKITFINGGKEFGPVVKSIYDLPQVIAEVLSNYQAYPYNKDKLPNYLLYNPGNATNTAITKINELLVSSTKSLRKVTKSFQMTSYILPKIKRVAKRIKNYIKFKKNNENKYAKGYIDAITTEKEAKKHGKSICEYLESQNDDIRKVGRRDRIINNIIHYFPNKQLSVIEIGTGTGMYLEKLLHLNLEQYDIYEINEGWKQYLKRTYGNNIVHILEADGIRLNHTPNQTIDVIHAHAVFVYLPIIQVLNYLVEATRVLVKNGLFIFDIINDSDLTVRDALNWNKAGHSFAVVIPHSFIEDFCILYGFEIISNFKEIYAGSTSTYYILKKIY